MADLALAGNTYAPLTAANPGNGAAWTAGVYYALPPLGRPPREHAPEYEELNVTFAGVDGTGVKNLGFRGRDMDIELIFVASDETAARSAKNALVESLQSARFSVTVPGGTLRPSCRLPRGGFRELRQFTLGGRFCLLCALSVRQLALS